VPFLGPVRIEVIEDAGERPLFRVLEPFAYRCDENRKTYVVDKEFLTDGASVPRFAFVWLIAGGKGLRAAILHDWLYSHGARLKQVKNRDEADGVFWWALIDSGHGRELANAMWDAVHVFAEDYFHA
jgi:hypothetical protein